MTVLLADDPCGAVDYRLHFDPEPDATEPSDAIDVTEGDVDGRTITVTGIEVQGGATHVAVTTTFAPPGVAAGNPHRGTILDHAAVELRFPPVCDTEIVAASAGSLQIGIELDGPPCEARQYGVLFHEHADDVLNVGDDADEAHALLAYTGSDLIDGDLPGGVSYDDADHEIVLEVSLSLDTSGDGLAIPAGAGCFQVFSGEKVGDALQITEILEHPDDGPICTPVSLIFGPEGRDSLFN